MAQVTQLLLSARDGDVVARDALFTVVYDELMRIARQRVAQNAPSTLLDAPALVNEVYLRLTERDALVGADRNAFFAFASTAMRNVVFDFARERMALKRGGGVARVTLMTDFAADSDSSEDADIEALNEALAELAAVDSRLHKVVELRYFGGLGLDAIAEIQGSSPATVKRDWTKARAFLFDALQRR